MLQNRILNLLGLACRARKIISGDKPVLQSLQNQRPRLVFIAADGNRDKQDKYRYICEQQHIPVIDIYTKMELGSAVGKKEHIVVALLDEGFAAAILKVLKEMK